MRARSQPLIEVRHAIDKRQHFDAAVVPAALTQVQQVDLGLRKIRAQTQQRAQIVGTDIVRHFYLEGAQPSGRAIRWIARTVAAAIR
jgi:hypothetical protein